MTPTQPLAASPSILYSAEKRPPIPNRPFSDPNLLAPEDAFYPHSPPRQQRQADHSTALDGNPTAVELEGLRGGGQPRTRRGKSRGRSGSRRGKGVWKKLLWVKQKDCNTPQLSTIKPLSDQDSQIQTTTPTLQPSSPTSNATPASAPTTSGLSSPTPQ